MNRAKIERQIMKRKKKKKVAFAMSKNGNLMMWTEEMPKIKTATKAMEEETEFEYFTVPNYGIDVDFKKEIGSIEVIHTHYPNEAATDNRMKTKRYKFKFVKDKKG